MKRETYETMFIPDELDEAVKKGIDHGKKERKKKKRKNIMAVGGSLAAGLALFITVCVANPALASKIPFIDKIFEKVEENAPFKGDYSDHSTHLADTLPENASVDMPSNSSPDVPSDTISETSEVSSDNSSSIETEETLKQLEALYGDTDQNITVTPEEVYCDGVSLYLGMRLTIVDDEGWGFESADDLGLRQGFQMIGNCEVDGNQTAFSNFITIGLPEKPDVLVGMIKLPADGISESEETLKVNIETICWNNFNKYYEVLGTPEEEKRPWYHVLAGDWNLTVPVTIDTSQTKVYQINESNAQGYGIAVVNVTPYEIQVLPIKPEEDANQFLGAFAVFNEKGEYFNWAEISSGYDCYVVDGKPAEHLYFYYFKDEIEAFKCKDQSVAKERSIYQYELDL